MDRQLRMRRWHGVAAAAALLAAGYTGTACGADDAEATTLEVTLSGSEEVPAVTTDATGRATITVEADQGITGAVAVSGMKATAAHVHEAPAGSNGPPVIPLEETTEGVWSVPPNVTLTDAQYESFKVGRLYINVHSEAHPAGEIRAQLTP